MKVSFLKTILIVFVITWVTFWFLIVIVHETGHVIVGSLLGYEIIEFHLEFPYLVGHSWVLVYVPPELEVQASFFYAGTMFCVIVGFLIALIPNLYAKIMGWIIMVDGIVYPLVGLFMGVGDFAQIHPYHIPIFFALTLGAYLFSFYITKNQWRAK
jgi:hypothetical protein